MIRSIVAGFNRMLLDERKGHMKFALSPWQVLLSLCSMVFSLPHLKWDEPIDHLELFAGVCSISRGEWEDFGGLLRSKSSSQMGHLFLLKKGTLFKRGSFL